jgi:hypothetical protein
LILKFEKGSCIVAKFPWYRKIIELQCEILDDETHSTIPKPLDQLLDINTNAQKKRIASASNDTIYSVPSTSKQKPNEPSCSEQDEVIRSGSRRRINAVIQSDEENSNSNTPLSSALSSVLSTSEKEDYRELSVNETIEKARKGEFPKKMFIFGRAKVFYTQRLHFFTSNRIFEQRPTENVKFTCKFCECTLSTTFPLFQNLNAHLKLHNKFNNEWLNEFNKDKSGSKSSQLDDATYDLIRYIISSNTALSQLENPFFQNLLKEKMKLPCIKTFRNTKLPLVYKQLIDVIDQKLDNALTITLITDIWTNKIMADFIGLAAVIVNKFKEREFFVIGMMGMPGNHTAENVKYAIEHLVNNYKFNKLKCHGIFTYLLIFIKFFLPLLILLKFNAKI